MTKLTNLTAGDVVHGRTVADAALRTVYRRVHVRPLAMRETAETLAPRVGTVVVDRGRARLLVLECRVEQWSQDEVDDQTLAPDGEPDAGWLARLTGVYVVPTGEEIAEDRAAAEQAASLGRRELLQQRIGALLGRATDRELPASDSAELRGYQDLPRVPTGHIGVGGMSHPHADAIHVDDDNDVLWLTVYAGRDGDSWANHNRPGFMVFRMPYTPQRRALVADLRREYELEQWEQRGIGSAAAAVLIGAGWSAASPPLPLRVFRITSADDAAALLQRTPEQWREVGWDEPWPSDPGRFSPADAARLADAGIGWRRAAKLAVSGHHDVEAILTATPPAIPSDATRIIITPRRPIGFGSGRSMTSDPAAARAYLQRHPEQWDATITADQIGIVHAESGWGLCENGEVIDADWIVLWDWDTRVDAAPARPSSLTPVAAQAIALVVGARNAEQFLAELAPWVWLRAARTHTTTTVEHRADRRPQWGMSCELIRHDYLLDTGATVTWWQVDYFEGGMSGGEGDSFEYYTLHSSEQPARQAWRTAD
ncbi:hypothetical protein [Nocardia sp. NPDC052566]|uniref:hypothetical protein n=1 Tax=Nocardia sp. NPDC052566 TaxID=3364330 RepID=UPI0037CBEBF0